MAKGKSGKSGKGTEETPSQLEREMEETRERLAATIDELLYRSHPKTIVNREIADIKAFFVDPLSGQPRTENILKVVGGLVGTVALFVIVRRISR